MLLLGLLLLTSALAGQRTGTRAESNLSSKLQLSSDKEQNGVQDPRHERVVTISGNGSIHSPKFPHTYPRNTVLVWRLVAVDENVRIQLTFDERFGLEDPEDDLCKDGLIWRKMSTLQDDKRQHLKKDFLSINLVENIAY